MHLLYLDWFWARAFIHQLFCLFKHWLTCFFNLCLTCVSIYIIITVQLHKDTFTWSQQSSPLPISALAPKCPSFLSQHTSFTPAPCRRRHLTRGRFFLRSAGWSHSSTRVQQQFGVLCPSTGQERQELDQTGLGCGRGSTFKAAALVSCIVTWPCAHGTVAFPWRNVHPRHFVPIIMNHGKWIKEKIGDGM